MADSTNARKLFQSGGSTVVSFPSDFLAEHDLEQGDRVRFRTDGDTIIMEEVEFTVSS
jgi:antitoxin component of MazEF toxin-antitoxin module